LNSSIVSPLNMGSGPRDFVPMGSPDIAKVMRAQRESFLQDVLQNCRHMVAAMHTIWQKMDKNGVLRRALA
jgi:hypothetical protein